MITFVRGPDRIRVTTLSWEAAQVYAQPMGWRTSGTMGTADGVVHSIYGPGRKVSHADSIRLAAALEKIVNGGHGDRGELDLDGIVLPVNFLRADTFAIW
jgi:hypothetical protein